MSNNNSRFLPKIVITDIDGVWTDGGMYYDQTGNELKRFNTSDSVGVYLCRQLSIPVAIMTGETTKIVERRAEKLKVDFLFQGVKSKLDTSKELCHQLNITLDEVAFIGDDINDIELLSAVGFSACPPNARSYIQSKVHYVTKLRGGDGAFRDMVEHLLGEDMVIELVGQYNLRLNQ